MYVDSHCHLYFPGLVERLPEVLANMRAADVGHALVVSVNLRDWPGLIALVEGQDNLAASVGVHPDNDEADDDGREPTEADLLAHTEHPRVVAIGETGLDYSRRSEPLDWQRDRFRTHIRVARKSGLPVIVHTRDAPEDTIRILREEGAERGVMHCFTESWPVAQAVLDLGFYISMAGIVTFKKRAEQVQEVARRVPLDRLLIETDSPFLAPVPRRGKPNEPAYVVHTARKIAELRGVPVETIAQTTTDNYFRLFSKAHRP